MPILAKLGARIISQQGTVMNHKLIIGLVSLLMLAACSKQPQPEQQKQPIPEAFTLVEEVKQTDGRLVIPYKKYQHKNGLTVILHQDLSDPLVHVDVTYHVGSAREDIGKSGFAHFFEHMMFQGSENVADDQHFKIITEAGGTMNGTTNSDRTNYFQTVPANQLEKVLWLEADRMGFFLDAVTQEKFEVQRATVKNEKAQNYENRPYGLLNEKVSEALYPEGHPYSWPTIGYVEDLDRVNVNDLKAFFLRWYGPNNAMLTIGGDFDEVQTLTWIEKYFGTIPTGPEVLAAEKSLNTLTETRYVSMEDQVHLPLIQMTFPTVYLRHPDEAPLDVLSSILGGGKSSLFFKNLVKSGHAVNALVRHPCRELACEFSLLALSNPGKTPKLSDIEQVIRDTLVEFETRGVNDDDLQKVKMEIESSTIYSLQSVSGKVSTLASNEYHADNPDLVQFDIERYKSVTKADVMRVYNQYIKDKPSVVMSIVPVGQRALIAAEDSFTFSGRTLPDYQSVDETALKLRKASSDFDRSVMPAPGENPAVSVPDFWQHKLDNGVTVLGSQTSETPTLTLTINMEGGPLLDSIDKAGLSSMTAAMMNESTENYSTEKLSIELDKLGSSISFSSSGRYSNVTVSSLIRNLDATLALLNEKLFKPAFKQEDFDRLKQQTLQGLENAKKDPNHLMRRATSQLLYGTHQRLGIYDGGILTSVSNIELQDVKDFYQRYYNPYKANIIAVGDIDKQTLLKKLAFLNGWQAKSYEIPAFEEFPPLDTSKIYFVNKDDAAQSVIRVVKHAIPYDATGEYFRNNLMNFSLGGAFNSRINMNLREDKGYTYGAWSGFSGGKTLGSFRVSTSVKKDNTLDSLNEIIKELKGYHEQGMTDAELEFMRSAYSQREALSYETPGKKAGFLRRLVTYGLDKSFVTEQNSILAQITKEELNKQANKWLDVGSMAFIVVGDAKTVKPQLEDLGLEIEDVTLVD
jgi:zinc protease